MIKHCRTTADPMRSNGFTLLEVLVVLTIMGLLAVLSIPGIGYLDRLERERITRGKMQTIRRAIVGPEDRHDNQGRPLVGGYVRDMKAWPDLWEPRAALRESFAGVGWENPTAMAAGLGQWTSSGQYTVNPAYVYLRPSGYFEGGRWKWHRPFRKLYSDTTTNIDHVGGLETENEGQPRGLWTRLPEEQSFSLTGHATPGEDLGTAWKGPYLHPPLDSNIADSGHWAGSDGEYYALEPTFHAATGYETWEEGDYGVTHGEAFDEKEQFRALQGDGRLLDGWGRAFKFFITTDPDNAGETIFWIVSEGADRKGFYPSKGSCSGHAWSTVASDVMGTAYNETHPYNKDNLVMKLYSRDWKASLEDQNLDKTSATRKFLETVRQALLGDAPGGINSGYSGDLLAWPGLFQWEGTSWDDQDSSTPYTKGQPRGLWTAKPNSLSSTDDLTGSKWGLGWRRAYLAEPAGSGENQKLKDAWGRELLFFYDSANDSMLILSRGPDGRFTFGTVSSDNTEPAAMTETLTISSYSPSAAYNSDNVYLIVRRNERAPGFFKLNRLVVYNATAGTTKARFYRENGTPVSGVDLLTCSTLTDEDGDSVLDDCSLGSDSGTPAAFNYHDASAYKVPTGTRYLVVWNDTNNNGEVDTGEQHYPLAFPVTAAAGSGQNGTVRLYASDLWAAP
jgi:prepilin-type N-terminal cleavage/methylation domain-containing protein